MSEDHATHRQHFFNIAEAQGEAKVQPNTMTDDFGMEAMTMIKRGGCASLQYAAPTAESPL